MSNRLPSRFESRRPEELPLEALTEPDVNVSAHPALPFLSRLWYHVLPVGKQPRLLTRTTLPPVDGQPLVVAQSFTLTHGPYYSPAVCLPEKFIRRGPVESAVIIDPSSDLRVEHPCKVFHRLRSAQRSWIPPTPAGGKQF